MAYPRRKRELRSYSALYALAFEMAVAVIVPILIGRWLDARTGKEPWFTIIGMVLGGAAAVRSAYRTLSETLEKEKKGEGSTEESHAEDSEKEEPQK